MHSWLISQFTQLHCVESFTAVSVMSLRRFAFSQRLHMLNTLMANLLLYIDICTAATIVAVQIKFQEELSCDHYECMFECHVYTVHYASD